MSQFSSLHPAVSAFYFASVLSITMFSANPILLIMALAGGILFYAVSRRPGFVFREFGIYLLLFVLIAITNPLFSHKGVTPLFFLNKNPITLEALLYGVDMAVMLFAVVYWFKCFNQIMTEEKLLFLFGKISPQISLLISSSLRFIPLFQAQAAKIRQAQQAMGLYASDTWTDKLKGTMRVYSALITWALENAIDTGSAMKARGYGIRGRSHYSFYTFRKADGLFLFIVAVLDGAVITAMAFGQLEFSFYPSISVSPLNPYSILAMAAFAVLSLFPFILQVKESLQWKYYRSKI